MSNPGIGLRIHQLFQRLGALLRLRLDRYRRRPDVTHSDLLVNLARDRFGLGGEDYREIAAGFCYAG